MSDFTSTVWKTLSEAAEGKADALERIYSDYKAPLLAYAQRGLNLDPRVAEELVHDFLTDVVAFGRLLVLASPEKGRFRDYLRTSFRNYVFSKQRRAKKEAPPAIDVDDLALSDEDLMPACVFDRYWALNVLTAAFRCWTKECHDRDPRKWQVFVIREILPLADCSATPQYEALCEQLNLPSVKWASSAMVNAKRSLRRHVRVVLRHQIVQRLEAERVTAAIKGGPQAAAGSATLPLSSDELEDRVEDELRDLWQVLDSPGDPISFDIPSPRKSGSVADSMMSAFASRQSSNAWASKLAESWSGETANWSELPEPTEFDLFFLARALLGTAPDTQGEADVALERELARPAGFALARLETDGSAAARQDGSYMTTLDELLQHRTPPVRLLRLTKEYAKSCYKSNPQDIPKEVAMVIYYSAIAAAWVRHRERISSLDVQRLQSGLQWIAQQKWVDPWIADLAQECLQTLKPG